MMTCDINTLRSMKDDLEKRFVELHELVDNASLAVNRYNYDKASEALKKLTDAAEKTAYAYDDVIEVEMELAAEAFTKQWKGEA